MNHTIYVYLSVETEFIIALMLNLTMYEKEIRNIRLRFGDQNEKYVRLVDWTIFLNSCID